MINNASYPYLYSDHNGHPNILYSAYTTGGSGLKWKIMLKNLNTEDVINISTPPSHPEHGIVLSETHPHYRIDNQNRINLCYIAEFANQNIFNKYFLCYILAKDLFFKFTDNINLHVVKATNVGCLTDRGMIYYASHPEITGPITTTPPINPKNQLSILDNQLNITKQFMDFGITEILDIKLIHNTNKYSITTKNSANLVKSYLLDNRLQICEEILNNQGNSVSGASIHNNILAYNITTAIDMPCIEIEEKIAL